MNDKLIHSARPAKRPLAGPAWPTQVSRGKLRGIVIPDVSLWKMCSCLCQIQPTSEMEMSLSLNPFEIPEKSAFIIIFSEHFYM